VKGARRFWGLYVHVCKLETLRKACALAKDNDGAPGIDGVTFAAIEAQGVEAFFEQIRDELVQRASKPLPTRRQEIPKDVGKVRVLSRVARPLGVRPRDGWLRKCAPPQAPMRQTQRTAHARRPATIAIARACASDARITTPILALHC
jgi:hypothetical protein